MSLMAMIIPPSLASQLDLNKCVQMCLIHDLPESLVGDLVPADRVPKSEKYQRESLAMDFLTKNLLGGPHSARGENIRALWQEYEDSESMESRFVQDVDKIELLLQMVEYEKRGDRKLDLSDFAYVATKVSLPQMKDWVNYILKEREVFWVGEKHPDAKDEAAMNSFSHVRDMQDEYYDRK